MAERLFVGEAEFLGGLTNEAELVKLCPEEFRDSENPWHERLRLLAVDGIVPGMAWSAVDEDELRVQKACLRGLYMSFGISQEDKNATAAWMLSCMMSPLASERNVSSVSGVSEINTPSLPRGVIK
ncbi:MAG: hypothetical protein RLZZ455_765 [Candidatus Parcubacteria bacterium]|jgi:hypothetical protein